MDQGENGTRMAYKFDPENLKPTGILNLTTSSGGNGKTDTTPVSAGGDGQSDDKTDGSSKI